jgi:hypothetical protein
MLAVLGGLADVERDLIRTRTAEGRSRAKAHGKSMGRPPSLNTGATERGHQTARSERYAGRTRPQLQCKPSHDFASNNYRNRFSAMPYQSHLALTEPRNRAARLWRYMSFASFLSVLDR